MEGCWEGGAGVDEVVVRGREEVGENGECGEGKDEEKREEIVHGWLWKMVMRFRKDCCVVLWPYNCVMRKKKKKKTNLEYWSGAHTLYSQAGKQFLYL
jgi:hypothetical protein